MTTCTYFNVQKFCLHDGPGVRTTVFLKGCPLRCAWCHNPESQHTFRELMISGDKCTGCGRCVGDWCPARTISEGRLSVDRSACTLCGMCTKRCFHRVNEICGRTGTAEEIMEQVEKDRIFYEKSGGGMTVSGGEPAMQPQFTLELLRMAKERGISSAMETCGFGDTDFYRSAAELGTLFLFDIKGMDAQRHRKNTGVGLEKIHANLDMLMDMGAEIVLRLPMIPGYNDSETDLALLRDFLREKKGKYLYAEIMPYHNLGVGKSRALNRPADETVPAGRPLAEGWAEILRQSGAEVRISGQ